MAHPSSQRALLFALSLSLTATTFPLVSAAARADDDGTTAPGVARISAIEGDVAIKHTDDGQGVAAVTNAPVEAGDYLSTGNGGRAEIQLDGQDVLRADSGAQLRFKQLDGSTDVAQLAQGTIELRTFDGYRDHVTVQTPSVDITPGEAGAYVITIAQNGNTEVTARSGSVTVSTPQGSQQLQPGRTMEIAGNANDPQYQYLAALATTGFDSWNDDRDREVLQVASLAPYEYVNDNVVGADDLAQDGRWLNTPDNGEVWQPDDVAANWTPYSNGSWAYEPYYGYTWVAAEPWGWAPYHYGRWLFQPGLGWAWAPGPRVAATVWSPALVAFLGFGNNIGWVPLAPGEPFHRWWGPGNTLVYNNTIVINRYRNYNRGIVAMPVNRWQSGDFTHIVHWQANNVRDARVIAAPISRTIVRTPVPQPRTTTWQRFRTALAQPTWQRFDTNNVRRTLRTYQQSAYVRKLPTYARQQPARERSQPVERQAPRERPQPHEASRPHKPGVMR